MEDPESFACPFCEFVSHDSYFILQHVELVHPEGGDSPFIAKDDLGENGNNDDGRTEVTEQSASPAYVQCPYDCGEQVLATELNLHTDFHIAERMALEDGDAEKDPPTEDKADALNNITNNFTTDLPRALRSPRTRSSPKKGESHRSFADFLLGSPNLPQRQSVKKSIAPAQKRVRRLGRAELGPYAHERQMPASLREMLEEGARVTVYNKLDRDGTMVRMQVAANETTDLIPVLAGLSQLDQTVERAFYCSPNVRHIVKFSGEGGFCGYRNIQMLLSYTRDAKVEGHEHESLNGEMIPSILKLQDLIERAWEMGFNSSGKIETGGIRGTRKYIGTPEAQALFQSLLIPCEASAFSTTEGLPSYKALFLAVAEYFSEDKTINQDEKLHMTAKPPIYFQYQGHSLTIVGMEVHQDHSLNLVVFDPMFKPSAGLLRLINSSSFHVANPDRLLRAHRRGTSYLEKFKDFEILKLTSKLNQTSS